MAKIDPTLFMQTFITVEQKIFKQRVIATELLHKLECIDPYAILAGGCPRDWYFNKPANDLDFYIHVKPETMSATAHRFKRLGLDVTPMNWCDNKEGLQYKCMEHLKRIYEGVYEGQKFQVMVREASTFDCVVKNFGTSVCEAWWKGKDVETTFDFLLSHHMKIIFKKADYTAKVLHVDKMIKRYPNYEVMDYKSVDYIKDRFCKEQNIYPRDHNIITRLKELI